MKDKQIQAIENCRLRMPADPISPKKAKAVVNFLDFNKILYAAKGPSLDKFELFDDYQHIATVNEACCKIDKGIEYAFFFDKNAILNSKQSWNKIKNFVTPSYVFEDKIDAEPVSISKIKDLPIHRSVFFEIDQIDFDESVIQKNILDRKLLTVDTSIMGLHYLVLCGYKEIYLLGHDGGIGYAEGVPCLKKNRNMQQFRDRIEFCAKLLQQEHGTNIIFYGQ